MRPTAANHTPRRPSARAAPESGLRGSMLLSAILISGALLGCSHGEGGPVARSGRPAEYGLHYVDEGSAAKLAYGVANSDDVGLLLLCEGGSRVVEIASVLPSGQGRVITLTSNGRRSVLPVTGEPAFGGSFAVGQAPAAAPALAGFRASGKIEISYAGSRRVILAKPTEKAAVRRFFDHCAGEGSS
jgi:hypothetical protein